MSKETLNTSREDLIRELGPRLRSPEQIRPAAGVRTGWSKLDQFLLWQGLPKAALTLMIRESVGATRLWTQAAAHTTRQGQWVAWINHDDTYLTPWSLRAQKVDLSKMLYVSQPKDVRQTLWALQELMSLCLFEMIGCDLGYETLKDHQVLKLKKLAMRYQTALVMFTATPTVARSSFFSLILHFQKDHVNIERALHRPTPFHLERRDLYADTLPLLAAGRRALCG